MEKTYFRVSEFCEIYLMGRTKAYQLINAGKIRIRKVGGSTLIDAASVREWEASLPTAVKASKVAGGTLAQKDTQP